MVRAIEAARKAARKALESTYEGKVTVTEYRKITDEKTKLTSHKEVVVLQDQPCKLSFEKLDTAVQGESAASITQAVKLFLSPDIIIIKPNSKLTVTQAGVTTSYTNSGIPAFYVTHQEIPLELFERWA